MSYFKSAKDILNSFQYSDTQQKAQKHVKFEFQDYAYRLAAELGDLNHRQIYMRLAKTTNRIMLEQAAAFAMDYTKERNKGKIFMWRLAQLREEAEIRAQKQNFDQQFIFKKTSELYDTLPEIFRTRERADAELFTPAVHQIFAGYSSAYLGIENTVPDGRQGSQKTENGRKHKPQFQNPKNFNIYVLGCGTGQLAKQLHGPGVRLQGADLSTKNIAAAKKSLKEAKFVRKLNFLDHKLKQNYYDWVLMPTSWSLVALENEPTYLRHCHSLLKPKGMLIFSVDYAAEAQQQWLEFSWKDKTYLRFHKQSSAKAVADNLAAANLHLFAEFDLGKSTLIVAQKLT